MKTARCGIAMLAALCALAFGGEAFARGGGGGGGQGLRLRDGSCVTNQQGTGARQQQMKQGPRSLDGTAQGKARRLGPGDGTGNAVPPKDGTGYGSPANVK